MDLKAMQDHAKNIRKNIIKEVSNAQSGHPGGSLGAADILTVLYFDVMDFTKENAHSLDRDRFVLSKGHASPLLYAVLAEKGIIDEAELLTFRKLNSRLQGHPDINELDGIDMSTGSLGQGTSASVGMALANRLDKNDHRIYALVGDGEAEEGQVWEAAMFASHYHLDNLLAIVDYNGLQIDGQLSEVCSPEPIPEKFAAFGWHVIDVKDGNDVEQISAAIAEAYTVKNQPTCLILNTVKGKGATFAEPSGAHSSQPTKEQWDEAIAASEAQLAAIRAEQ